MVPKVSLPASSGSLVRANALQMAPKDLVGDAPLPDAIKQANMRGPPLRTTARLPEAGHNHQCNQDLGAKGSVAGLAQAREMFRRCNRLKT